MLVKITKLSISLLKKFHNKSMKSWVHDNDIEKYITAVSRSVYFDKLDEIKQNNETC